MIVDELVSLLTARQYCCARCVTLLPKVSCNRGFQLCLLQLHQPHPAKTRVTSQTKRRDVRAGKEEPRVDPLKDHCRPWLWTLKLHLIWSKHWRYDGVETISGSYKEKTVFKTIDVFNFVQNCSTNTERPLCFKIGPFLCFQVLEYALNTTNGQETKNLVPVSTRHPLIISWVFCKQLLNQQIPKNLGHDDEVGRNWEFFSFWYYRQWLMSRKTRYLLCGQFSLVWNNSIRVYLTTESTRFKPVSLFDGLSASIYFTLLFRRFSFYFQTMWIGEYFIFVFVATSLLRRETATMSSSVSVRKRSNLYFLTQDPHSQGPMCRALCAVEMLSLQNNGLPEFTGTCPSLAEVSLNVHMVLM